MRSGSLVQTQEMIAGGRYLSGDDYARSFAANGKTRVEVSWPGGMVSVVADAAIGCEQQLEASVLGGVQQRPVIECLPAPRLRRLDRVP